MGKRELFITNEITREITPYIQTFLKECEEESQIDPIKIYINCFGGSLNALFSILDMIKNCKCPIYTVDIGEADSAAALILAAGTKRFITQNSRVMLHEVQISMFIDLQPTSAVRAQMKEFEIFNDRFFTELSKLTKKERSVLEKDIIGKDLYLSAKEAIEYGVVDEIVTPEIIEQYQLNKKVQIKKENKTMMTKEEMISALKKDFDIDVENIKTELNESKKKNEVLEKVNKEQKEMLNATKAKLANIEADLENKKKNEIITRAISEMKIYPSEKETYLSNFKTAEELENFVKKLEPKLTNKAQGKNDNNNDSSQFDAATQRAIDKGAISKEDAEKFILNKKEEE